MKEYLLDDLQLIVNHSGYMRGMIFNKWLNEILSPHVNEKRATPDQHTLLICDTHVSSINEEEGTHRQSILQELSLVSSTDCI